MNGPVGDPADGPESFLQAWAAMGWTRTSLELELLSVSAFTPVQVPEKGRAPPPLRLN